VKKLYYYVQNGGDGSAIVRFCESRELAELLDRNQSEGWGESSVGEVPSQAQETVADKIQEIESAIKDGDWVSSTDRAILPKLKKLL